MHGQARTLPVPPLGRAPAFAAPDPAAIEPARALLYSALAPGAGQHALGQRRWIGYAVAEALGWWYWIDRRGEGFDLRDDYRDVAWERARLAGGERVDGDFEYYETLLHWTRSGRWDLDPSSPGVEPEEDAETFNGSIWLLARQLFVPGGAGDGVEPTDPGYDKALAYYRQRAYGPDFLWDWSQDPEAQARFAELVEASDDRLREATVALGLVAANHVLSAADAFVSARLREASGGRLDASLGWEPRPPPPRGRWGGHVPPLSLGLRIRH